MSKRRVLIVDDEAPVIRILGRALKNAGYEVEECYNGAEAFERIIERQPDVLVTDIEMPRMTGKELCMKIDEELPDRNFPIIVQTSVTAREHREWSSAINDLAFLEKPLSARRLLSAIDAYFECDLNRNIGNAVTP